jgi:hypothetical protein
MKVTPLRNPKELEPLLTMAVGFMELLDGVGYPVVKGWLAVLLDEGFILDRLNGSEFYRSTGILVELKREEIAKSLCEPIAC